jgi:hypothetical protein
MLSSGLGATEARRGTRPEGWRSSRSFDKIGRVAETDDDRHLDEALRAVERLGPAIKARAIIEQAKVLVMAQLACGESESFELLADASQRERVKLVDIATQVKDTVLSAGRLPAVFDELDLT